MLVWQDVTLVSLIGDIKIKTNGKPFVRVVVKATPKAGNPMRVFGILHGETVEDFLGVKPGDTVRGAYDPWIDSEGHLRASFTCTLSSSGSVDSDEDIHNAFS